MEIKEDLCIEKEAYEALIQEGGRPSHPVHPGFDVLDNPRGYYFILAITPRDRTGVIPCSVASLEEVFRLSAKSPRTSTETRALWGCGTISGARPSETNRASRTIGWNTRIIIIRA
jgi:hypothetical protein